MKRFLVTLFLACVCMAQDSARQLARILTEKGILTSDELGNIERAGADDAVRLLTAALYQKGILTPSEIARVYGPPAGASGEVRFSPVVATTYMPPAAVASAVVPTTPASSTQATTSPSTATVQIPGVTSGSHFPIQLYGTVLWNSFYNTGGTNVEDIPLVASKVGTDPNGNFGMTVRQSRFGLRYDGGPEIFGGKLSGDVEVDLLGGAAALTNGVNMDLIRLRLAYGRVDWTNLSMEAGQDWAVFSPLNPTSFASFAIPAMSTSGNPWIRSPQVRFEWRSDPGHATRLLLQTALLDPNVGDNPTTVVDARTPGIGERGRGPAVESRLALTGKVDDRDASVGFSGHYGRGDNVGTLNGVTVGRPVDSWGVNLDYTLPVSKYFALTGEAFTGRALGLFSVSSGQSVLAVGTVGEHGVLASGGWAQAQFNINKKWQINLAYGLESDEGYNLITGSRAKNQTYMTNLVYKFSPHITWAWEWRRLLTKYQNQQTLNANINVGNMAIAYVF
jgi:hypothetical protein